MLWQPELHEPPTEQPWNDARVRERIRAIVKDAEDAYNDLWPAHEWDGWQAATPMKNLYVGAAGVVWAIDALRRRGEADVELDLARVARRALDAFREAPDYIRIEEHTEPRESGLLCGETGILAVAWRLAPGAALADELFARLRANVHNDANELMWGAPGTMLAARAMHGWTGERRWLDVWDESAEELRRRRDADGRWTVRVGGNEFRGLSPVHGLTGNVLALLQGGPDEQLVHETAAVLEQGAVHDAGLANWNGDEFRLQWCWGAPGIVVGAASYLPEELLLAAAELIWRAGPPTMEKGAGICHGTAGNGYAFLKVFERTGDERWLDRARRFAMHALEQVERRGQGRYSLWTGDVGVALYLADCIDARAAYPILDTWD
jgi:lantibiotic modifying enzyme